MHLHVVDVPHRVMISVRGIGSGPDLGAGVATVASVALVAGPASMASVQTAAVVIAVLVAASAAE